MTHDEAVSVLESIEAVYPSFSVTTKKAQMLIPALKQMDYDGVMAKFSDFLLHHKFAPTISEIAVYPRQDNPHIQRHRQWRQAADDVAPNIKERFHAALSQLISEKGDLHDS